MFFLVGYSSYFRILFVELFYVTLFAFALCVLFSRFTMLSVIDLRNPISACLTILGLLYLA